MSLSYDFGLSDSSSQTKNEPDMNSTSFWLQRSAMVTSRCCLRCGHALASRSKIYIYICCPTMPNNPRRLLYLSYMIYLVYFIYYRYGVADPLLELFHFISHALHPEPLGPRGFFSAPKVFWENFPTPIGTNCEASWWTSEKSKVQRNVRL